MIYELIYEKKVYFILRLDVASTNLVIGTGIFPSLDTPLVFEAVADFCTRYCQGKFFLSL